MICFYNEKTLDGQCAAAIIKKFNIGCKLVGVNENSQLDFSLLKNHKIVVVVDYCFSEEEMKVLDNWGPSK